MDAEDNHSVASNEQCDTAMPSASRRKRYRRRKAKITRCQVVGCGADLSLLGKLYCARKGLCPTCMKAPSVLLQDGDNQPLRFCFQCAKLEPLSAFDGQKRSCAASLLRRQANADSAFTPRTRHANSSSARARRGGAGSAADVDCAGDEDGRDAAPRSSQDSHVAPAPAAAAATSTQMLGLLAGLTDATADAAPAAWPAAQQQQQPQQPSATQAQDLDNWLASMLEEDIMGIDSCLGLPPAPGNLNSSRPSTAAAAAAAAAPNLAAAAAAAAANASMLFARQNEDAAAALAAAAAAPASMMIGEQADPAAAGTAIAPPAAAILSQPSDAASAAMAAAAAAASPGVLSGQAFDAAAAAAPLPIAPLQLSPQASAFSNGSAPYSTAAAAAAAAPLPIAPLLLSPQASAFSNRSAPYSTAAAAAAVPLPAAVDPRGNFQLLQRQQEVQQRLLAEQQRAELWQQQRQQHLLPVQPAPCACGTCISCIGRAITALSEHLLLPNHDGVAPLIAGPVGAGSSSISSATQLTGPAAWELLPGGGSAVPSSAAAAYAPALQGRVLTEQQLQQMLEDELHMPMLVQQHQQLGEQHQQLLQRCQQLAQQVQHHQQLRQRVLHNEMAMMQRMQQQQQQLAQFGGGAAAAAAPAALAVPVAAVPGVLPVVDANLPVRLQQMAGELAGMNAALLQAQQQLPM